MSERLQRQYHIGQTVVPYTIDWSENRETIGLSIDSSLELTVTAPMTATVADVEEVLESRHEWILQKLYGLQEQEGPPYPKEYMTGEKLQYRGRQYPLEVVEADIPEPTLSFDEQGVDVVYEGTEFRMEKTLVEEATGKDYPDVTDHEVLQLIEESPSLSGEPRRIAEILD